MGHIIVDSLTINFRKRQEKGSIPFLGRKSTIWSAVKDISFTVKDGEKVGIIGKNGAGKSILLKAISGIYSPHLGQIEVCGSLIPLLELGTGFDNKRSVRENIYLNGAIMGLTNEEVKELEEDVIEFAELEAFTETQLKNLSSGMRSRLGFSIATRFNPEILILDEVFAAGDASFIEKAKKRMYSMIDRCQILLLVSHRLSLIEELCERVLVIDKGVLVYDGPTNDGLKLYQEKIHESHNQKPKKRVKLL